MESIFMVGEQRSGSNLLRLILNQSPELVGPHPPHILQRFIPLLPLYGSLKKKTTFMRLIDDVCRLVEYNPVPWEGVSFDRSEVYNRCRENNLIAVYGAIMDIYAEVHNAKGWICKSMQNIRWAKEIDKYFASPKYIYLYRDGRDVALSFMKAVIGDKHPYFIAQQWAELQRLCLAERGRIGVKHFFSLCYEDLTSKSEEVIRDLCDFLNIEFTQDMLAFHNSNEAQRAAGSSQLWQNVTQPIMAQNSRKFMKEMSKNDVSIIESVAGDVLDALHYERAYIKPGKEMEFSKTDIARFTKENEKKKKAMAGKVDKQDVKRRQKQAQIIDEIRAMAS